MIITELLELTEVDNEWLVRILKFARQLNISDAAFQLSTTITF